MAGPKSKIVRGALEALTDVTDEAIDVGRREFLKKTPVGAAGVTTGLGTGVVLGAKALFAKGGLDKIIEKIKSAFDENWQDISLYTTDSPTGILQKKLGIDDNEFAKISEDTIFYDQFDIYDLNPEEMTSSEISKGIKSMTDDHMGSYAWDFSKGRGDNPSTLINEFKIPAFKNEVSKQFPGLDPSEIDELANRLF